MEDNKLKTVPPASLDQAENAAKPDPQSPVEIRRARSVEQAYIAQQFSIPINLSEIMGKETLDGLAAKFYMDVVKREAGKPTDPIERMLLEQMVLTHHHIAMMHTAASRSKTLEAVKVHYSMLDRVQVPGEPDLKPQQEAVILSLADRTVTAAPPTGLSALSTTRPVTAGWSTDTAGKQPVSGRATQNSKGVSRITDDNLWRATRRAKERLNENKLTTRRGPVHSNGWLARSPTAEGNQLQCVFVVTTETNACNFVQLESVRFKVPAGVGIDFQHGHAPAIDIKYAANPTNVGVDPLAVNRHQLERTTC